MIKNEVRALCLQFPFSFQVFFLPLMFSVASQNLYLFLSYYTIFSPVLKIFYRHRTKPLALRPINQQLYVDIMLRQADKIVVAKHRVKLLCHYFGILQAQAKANNGANISKNCATRFRLMLPKILIGWDFGYFNLNNK